MSDFPTIIYVPHSVITIDSQESIGNETTNTATVTTAANIGWGTSNLAYLMPFRIAIPTTIVKMFWVNGSSVGTNSRDVGIYDSQGNRLVSTGNTLTAGATALQTVSITSTTLQYGLYYMAISQNGTTNTIVGTNTNSAPFARALGAYTVTSSNPLPSTITFAGSTSAVIPFLGMSAQGVI